MGTLATYLLVFIIWLIVNVLFLASTIAFSPYIGEVSKFTATVFALIFGTITTFLMFNLEKTFGLAGVFFVFLFLLILCLIASIVEVFIIVWDYFIKEKEREKTNERDSFIYDDEEKIKKTYDTKPKAEFKAEAKNIKVKKDKSKKRHFVKALASINAVNEEITPTEKPKNEIVRNNKEFEKREVMSNKQRRRMESVFGKDTDAKDIYGHTIDKHFEMKNKKRGDE